MNSTEICKNVPTPSCMQQPLSVATPDGGLLYTGFKSINYITAPPLSEKDATASEVKTMSTRFTINALDVSPLWGQPDNNTLPGQNHGRHFAIVAEDFSVQVWDCALGEAIIGHKAHQHQHEARDLRMFPFTNVLMSYISNGNILSIDPNDLVVYCVASNSYCRRPMFISGRNNQLSVLRCSPYNENLFALGTTSGLVMVCDLRQMSTLFKFNSHGQNIRICGLAWRKMSPRSVNSPLANRNEQWRSTAPAAVPAQAGKAPLLKSKAAESDDCFDIYNFDHLESEFGVPVTARTRLASKSSDDCGDFVGIEKLGNNVTIDYMEACESLKAELLGQSPDNSESAQVEVNLQDCEKTKALGPKSDGSNVSQKDENSVTLVSNSTEGSLEVLQYHSSSDDGVIVDGEASKPKREVLHHIYHQAEVHDAPESAKAAQQPQQQAQAQASAEPIDESCSDTISTCDSVARSDILLVSINENDIITIWNTLNGAHCGKNYSKGHGTGKLNQVHWLNDNTIVSLSRQQFLFWSLTFDDKMQRYKIQKDQLNKCAEHDIITFAPSSVNQQIWLCMKNRRVGMLNPLSGQLNALYGCLAFGVRAMAECPDDMNKIALGCSDKRLALFDISKLSTRCIPIEGISLNSNVYSLAWSPDCLQLAFGTFDGTVGILGVERMKIRTTLHTAHKKEIYSLMWQDNYIYFIVNRQLGVFDVRQSKPGK